MVESMEMQTEAIPMDVRMVDTTPETTTAERTAMEMLEMRTDRITETKTLEMTMET